MSKYELLDTGIFDDDRFFDVEVVYAKAAPEQILMRLRATNMGPEPAPLHIVPTVWFRSLGHATRSLVPTRISTAITHACSVPRPRTGGPQLGFRAPQRLPGQPLDVGRAPRKAAHPEPRREGAHQVRRAIEPDVAVTDRAAKSARLSQ